MRSESRRHWTPGSSGDEVRILRPAIASAFAGDLVTALGSGRLQRAKFGNHLCFVRLRASVMVVQSFMHGREVAERRATATADDARTGIRSQAHVG